MTITAKGREEKKKKIEEIHEKAISSRVKTLEEEVDQFLINSTPGNKEFKFKIGEDTKVIEKLLSIYKKAGWNVEYFGYKDYAASDSDYVPSHENLTFYIKGGKNEKTIY